METLDRIVGTSTSVCRFGDGELRQAFTNRPLLFQRWSSALQDRLLAALTEPKAGVLATFNNYYLDNPYVEWIARYERYPKRFARHTTVHSKNDIGVLQRWRDCFAYAHYWRKTVRATARTEFGDTSFLYLGCYLDAYRHNEMDEVLDKFRRLFSGRRILVVGPAVPLGGAAFRDETSRIRALGVSDLDFIEIPATDAFEIADDLATEIRSRSRGFTDIFLQAGPTATILAYELHGTIDARLVDVGSLNTQVRYLT